MKLAMQNKDSDRLSVLRSLLSQTLNASKTAKPISTDIQMAALLRKSADASRVAQAEFNGAGRADLAEKEENQRRVMEEYLGGVEVVGEEEITSAVQSVVDALRSDGIDLKMGDIMKRVLAPGLLGDKPVQKSDVAKAVEKALKQT
jgi:uncharacterized protein YqeY